MKLVPGAYNVNLCVLDELMHNDVKGLITKVKKPGNHDEYYLLFNDYISVAHAIVTEGGQIRSTMTKEQLQAMFYSLLGECPLDLQAPYSVKKSTDKVSQDTADFTYMLAKSCPYNIPVFVDDTMYFLSVQSGDTMLGGKPLTEWELDNDDLEYWVRKCNPLNFQYCGDLSTHFASVSFENKGEVEYTVGKHIYLHHAHKYYSAIATSDEDFKSVLNVAFHKIPIGSNTYEQFMHKFSRAVRDDVDNNYSIRFSLDYGVKRTFTVMRGENGVPITNAPVAVVSNILANWLINRDRIDELKDLTGILEYDIAFKDNAVKCNIMSKSALYSLMKLAGYPITFKSGEDYFTVSMKDTTLRVFNGSVNRSDDMDLFTDTEFSYELPELIEIVKGYIPVEDMFLRAIKDVDDFDDMWENVKVSEQLNTPFELKIGTIGPYLCILCKGYFMLTNTYPYNLREYMKGARKVKSGASGTLEEMLDMYCALDKSTDYAKVIANLLREAGVAEKVSRCLSERLSK